MNHRGRGLMSAMALAAASAFLGGGIAEAQHAAKVDADVIVQDLEGDAVPFGMLKVRDFQGRVLVPEAQAEGVLRFHDVGPKLVIDLGLRGPKAQPIEITLIDARRVFVNVRTDPATGRVKYVIQKAFPPELEQRDRDRVRAFPGNGQRRLVPPANDDCANATATVSFNTNFTTVDATTDGTQPTNCGMPSNINEDVWFSAVAPRTGVATFEITTATFDTKMAVYEGCGTNPIACEDDGGTGMLSKVSVPVLDGGTYLIRIGSVAPGATGTGTLQVTPPSLRGAFDDCATAPEVICGAAATAFNNSGGSVDALDPAFTCLARTGFGTSWFKFVATETNATIDTEGSQTGDTVLAVYSGTCGNLFELGCANDGGTVNPNLATLTVSRLIPGETYYIQVAGVQLGNVGQNMLKVMCQATQGDHCDNALPYTCGGSPVNVDLARMSVDPTDPNFDCRFNGAGQGAGTAWITFIADFPTVRIHTNASPSQGTNDTLLALYEDAGGVCPGGFTPLACSEDEGNGLLSDLCYDKLIIGDTYFVEVAAYSELSLGAATVTIDCNAHCPRNDDCADIFIEDTFNFSDPFPFLLGTPPVSVTFDTRGATTDIGMPCGVFTGPFDNVWYTVTGTGNTITATTCNAGTSHPDTEISVFCGECGGPVCITGNDDDPTCGFTLFSTVTWCSEEGREYLVTVGGFNPTAMGGIVQLDVTDGPPFDCTTPFPGCPALTDPDEGACCLPDGSCVDQVRQSLCEVTLGGTYLGNETECIPNAVADGGLEHEAGAVPGNWSESSTNFATPLCDGACGFGGGTGPRTGHFWAWFGGIHGFEEGSLGQLVTIPPTTTMLEFYLEVPTVSGNGTDFLEVTIDGAQIYERNESAGDFVGYQLVSIPIAGFADGLAHNLEFHSICTGLTNFFVDDISMDSTVPSCPPFGACCLPDGSCVAVLEADCLLMNGVYRGDGTACVANAVNHGGFEDGPFGPAWVEDSDLFGTPVCSLAMCGNGGGTGPRTGTYWAYFGGRAEADDASVEQNVTIPAGAATLDFYLEVPATSGNPNDFLEVTIDGVPVYTVLGNSAPFVGYQLVSIPIADFADNGVHVLRFHALTSQPRSSVPPSNTTFFVDDVGMGSCP